MDLNLVFKVFDCLVNLRKSTTEGFKVGKISIFIKSNLSKSFLKILTTLWPVNYTALYTLTSKEKQYTEKEESKKSILLLLDTGY